MSPAFVPIGSATTALDTPALLIDLGGPNLEFS